MFAWETKFRSLQALFARFDLCDTDDAISRILQFRRILRGQSPASTSRAEAAARNQSRQRTEGISLICLICICKSAKTGPIHSIRPTVDVIVTPEA